MSPSDGPVEVRFGPAELTGEFWAACSRGELVRPMCRDCGRSFFTPRVACPFCLSTNWEYVPSSGVGTVYSHTTVHRGPDRDWDVPYVLGVVDMTEGWSLLTRLLVDDPDPDGPGGLIGTTVRVVFIPEPGPPHARHLPAFAPEETAQ